MSKLKLQDLKIFFPNDFKGEFSEADIVDNVSVLYDVADFQHESPIRSTKVELVKMFNRSTSAAILYSTC
jgi:hypothetical protein